MSPELLAGKRLVVSGVATRSSIAYHVAERAADGLPVPVDVLELDATRPEDFERLQDEPSERWGTIDGGLHAIAYAPPDALGGAFLDTPPDSAATTFVTSAYSLKALGATLRPLMIDGGSLVALDFDATVAWPVYDWMGVAKAALEAAARYLARDLGPDGIRVNLVSAGPLATVAAGGIPGFEQLAGAWGEQAPLGWNSEDARPVADAVCFLFSNLARAITGEVLHVDGGFHAMGAPLSGEPARPLEVPA
jgi:enoyl-[acyl-carrier protein] reductase I